MSPIISYRFPLDSLENQQINNQYTDISVSTELSDSKIDFDAQRGSFLSLNNHDFIQLTFNALNIEPEKSYLINLFFNNQVSGEGGQNGPFLNIDDQYSLSIRNNILCVNNDQCEKIINGTWYNVTVKVSSNNTKTYLFNKEIAHTTAYLGAIKQLKIGGTGTSGIKISDLSIQEEVNAFALEKIRNNQNFNDLSVFSTIHFQLYNKAAYKNRLFLEDDESGLFLDIDFGKYLVDFEPGKAPHIILKAKKGFFKKKENTSDTAIISTEGDDFCIRLKADATKIIDHKLFIPIPSAQLVNLRNQDQVLVQLELCNCRLKSADQTILLSGEHSIKTDQTVAIQDNLGADRCPFDVFVLGNDTLYNGKSSPNQTIILRVMNNVSESIVLQRNATFKITSGQMGILKDDVMQTVNVKVKDSAGKELMINRDHSLKVEIAVDTIFSDQQWIDIVVLGIQAKPSSANFPSGSYPFYLEYRNIAGYRSGKIRFYIRTGSIFYSN